MASFSLADRKVLDAKRLFFVQRGKKLRFHPLQNIEGPLAHARSVPGASVFHVSHVSHVVGNKPIKDYHGPQTVLVMGIFGFVLEGQGYSLLHFPVSHARLLLRNIVIPDYVRAASLGCVLLYIGSEVLVDGKPVKLGAGLGNEQLAVKVEIPDEMKQAQLWLLHLWLQVQVGHAIRMEPLAESPDM
ncbi:hypothetical protein CTRI78_v004174 [Colletotrichum trifolii]|uniref:Uncharacterized protein n=1 Tax=Colletotrichum trifolii TaxID=5466 RepID=A0A4R8RHL3_COLTR|nr:hypothetical protein CTRI78_v004174 [Colletotrichum trifolii]